MNKVSIPAFSLSRQVSNMRPQLVAALEKVLDNQSFIGGHYIETIEKELASYLGVKHVIACNSGTDALWMALHALELPQNGIVLTTPFSFIASSSEIVALGAHPVFIDIEQETFNINPELLEQWLIANAEIVDGKAIHKATGFPIVGIVPVDLFGQPANYQALKIIAQTWNLWMVEDCAQAIGAEYNGQKAGTLGTIGAFSFYPTKNLGAFGDGGCCATNDPILAERLLQLRNHGRKTAYEYLGTGINSRLDAMQAVILSEKLPHLDAANARRRAIAERYNTALRTVPFVKVPEQKTGIHVYHQYSLIVEDEYRSILEKHLADHGIQTRIFYPQTLPDIAFLRTHAALTTACPVADHTVRNVLALPMWPELTDEEVDFVIQTVKSMPYKVVAHTDSIKSAGQQNLF